MSRVFLLLVFLVSFNNCLAKSNESKLPTLQVVTEDWPPFNYRNDDGDIVGIATERVTSILASANLEYKILMLPWARALETATNKPNTLIYSIYRTKERESLFHWFCPILPSSSFYAYALTENAITINTIEELKNFTIAVARNEVEHTYLNNLGFEEGNNLYISAEDETSFEQVLNNRVDLFIESPISIEVRLRNRDLPIDYVTPVFKIELEGQQHCIALSKGSSAEMIKRISDAFENNQLVEEH